ncbi:MAG: tol-pal system protein YbgF [Gammaproteobacteria bacterium]|nr:tol-pal system protein YbgF [Gammaproteobacteria bacterium]MBU0788749.1 tol-pal system protein YbgF [Gammaproteobacteria bacterium]MBU0814631.1 tol-pal system protein YbgF [Gammaproteobacteria bacterium]MBU1786526.1 tol-pal system protein YbgF [Gammaproteobacteria bacterium]
MKIYKQIVLTVGACVWAVASHAALFEDDEARKAILDLRQRVEAGRLETEQRLVNVARQSEEENASLRRSLLDLQNLIEGLRTEMAKIRGQNEQLARDVAEVQRIQKDTAQSLEDRLRKFEPTKVTLEGKEFTAEPAEIRDFEAALAVFRRSEFAAAQNVFAEFVKRYPKSGYLPSALFWLGNAQYATGNYKDAITNFRALLLQAPDHFRAPEAVLSIANCQIELKDLKGARKTLEELIKAYPQSEAAGPAKDRLARMK